MDRVDDIHVHSIFVATIVSNTFGWNQIFMMINSDLSSVKLHVDP